MAKEVKLDYLKVIEQRNSLMEHALDKLDEYSLTRLLLALNKYPTTYLKYSDVMSSMEEELPLETHPTVTVLQMQKFFTDGKDELHRKIADTKAKITKCNYHYNNGNTDSSVVDKLMRNTSKLDRLEVKLANLNLAYRSYLKLLAKVLVLTRGDDFGTVYELINIGE